MARRILIVLGIVAAFAAGWQAGRLQSPGPPPKAVDSSKPPAASEASAASALLPAPPAPAPLTPAEPDPVPTPADYPEIMDALRTGSLEAPALLGEPLTTANLPEFLQRAGAKARFSATATQGPPATARSLLELLPGGIAYWRPRSFDPAETTRLAKEWSIWRSGKPIGLIIDLRYFTDTNNFAGAAPVVSLFTSPGRTLFTLQSLHQAQKVFKSERQPMDLPSWMPLVVLTNHHTRGAAEAVAYVLSTQAGAFLLGQPTAGEAGLYRETRLKSGLYLRVASAEAVAADGTELLGRPLEPDVWVEMDPVQERAAFAAAATAGAASTLAEPPPLPRLNQDLRPLIVNAGSAMNPAPVPLADPILKAGVDAITALHVRLAKPALP